MALDKDEHDDGGDVKEPRDDIFGDSSGDISSSPVVAGRVTTSLLSSYTNARVYKVSAESNPCL